MKKYKGFTIGLLTGIIITATTPAFAAIGDKAEAIFTQFNFVINGQAKTLDESPVVINGSSYLPVRSISNTLGYDVTYKADSRTIELNGTGGVSSSSAKAQGVTPRAQATQVSPVEDKYAGKVFVSNADLIRKISKETDKTLEINNSINDRVVIFDSKEILLSDSNYYYDINTRNFLIDYSEIEKIIPISILSDIPKYQISNGIASQIK